MRSMKYLPSVSTLSSVKHLRQMVHNSMQKINAIDVNVFIDKYFSGNSGGRTEIDVDNSSQKTRTIEEKLKELSDRSKANPIPPKKPSDEEENQLFESAMTEWIELKNHLNVGRNQVSDSASLPKAKVTEMASDLEVPSVPTTGVELRTKQLLQSMSRSDSDNHTRLRLKELNKLLVTHPEAIPVAVKQNAVQKVLRLHHWSHDQAISQLSNQALALLGYVRPPKGAGIRILSLDGGGTRGVLVIEILREFERRSGKPIHEMFDLICGVSTGAIIGMLLGALKTPIPECEDYYHRFSSNLFKSDFFRGAGRLIWSHAYYDTTIWEKVLKTIYSETNLIETKQSADTPHVVAISAVMNKPSIEAFLWRNYELPVHTRPLSKYEGSSKYKIWEAVRASGSAPGFFEEFRKDRYVHQDGGILINNPTAVAIHEAKLLWPNEQIQCILSIGSGRYIPPNNFKTDNAKVTSTSLKTKIIRLIDSATDTEMVHRLMRDLLPQDIYFRINPFLTEVGTLDENRPEKLNQMKNDAKLYLHKNEYKVKKAVEALTRKRGLVQRIDDWLRLQYSLRV